MDKNFVVISVEAYAELLDMKTRMSILADEAKRQNAEHGYYVFDGNLMRVVLGGKLPEEQKEA